MMNRLKVRIMKPFNSSSPAQASEDISDGEIDIVAARFGERLVAIIGQEPPRTGLTKGYPSLAGTPLGWPTGSIENPGQRQSLNLLNPFDESVSA
jgi:hypothetical protein